MGRVGGEELRTRGQCQEGRDGLGPSRIHGGAAAASGRSEAEAGGARAVGWAGSRKEMPHGRALFVVEVSSDPAFRRLFCPSCKRRSVLN